MPDNYYFRNRTRILTSVRKRTKELSTIVITAYGGKCECCGESNPDFLVIGCGERGESNRVGRHGGGRHLYQWLVTHNYPKDNYHLLCRNRCLSIKVYGYCPHNPKSSSIFGACAFDDRKKRYRVNRKLAVIDAYGGKCCLCGETISEFLVIDHINGGGKQHRKEMHDAGTDIYVVLRSLDYPQKDYRLLCFNCNDKRGSRIVAGLKE